jgi:hypothetical protein
MSSDLLMPASHSNVANPNATLSDLNSGIVPDRRREGNSMNGVKPATVRVARLAAFLLLGLLLPGLLLFQAHQAMGRMSDVAGDGNDLVTVLKSLPPQVQRLQTQNDYALLSIAMVEASNQRTMLTKQRMKMSVMHIGFAVISLGLMMLVMGLEAGGIDVAAGSTHAPSFDLKTTSTAVTAIVLGAVMSGAGALVPNPYTTVSVPSYAPVSNTSQDDRLVKLRNMATQCAAEAPKAQLAACFQNSIVTTLSEQR